MEGRPGATQDPTRDPSATGILAFLSLTFLVTWTCWFGWSAFTRDRPQTSPLFLLGVFAPAFVALALTRRAVGRDALRALVRPIGRWRVAARYYSFAVLYMAATRLAAAVLHRLIAGAWPAFGRTPFYLLAAAIVFSTWVQAGEEIGWRGYALPRLAARIGLGGAALLLGVIWAFWHLPLFFLPDTGSTDQSFPVYLLSVTAISVAMAWLYWRTGGSLLLVMLMHASVNNTSEIVPAAVPGATNPLTLNASSIAWLTVAVSWIVAAILLVRMRGADLRDATAREA